MDRPKQLLDWFGLPLIAYQVRQLLCSGVGQTIVVLGHEIERIRPVVEHAGSSQVIIAVNPDYRTGKTSSIKAGLKAIGPGPSCILLQAADQPRPAELIRELVEEHVKTAAQISIPSLAGKHGHPPVFDAAFIPELLEITEESQGVLGVIERHRNCVREVAIDDPIVLTNLNTEEDYRRALSLTESGSAMRHIS